jgi:hypothetical protein
MKYDIVGGKLVITGSLAEYGIKARVDDFFLQTKITSFKNPTNP